MEGKLERRCAAQGQGEGEVSVCVAGIGPELTLGPGHWLLAAPGRWLSESEACDFSLRLLEGGKEFGGVPYKSLALTIGCWLPSFLPQYLMASAIR